MANILCFGDSNTWGTLPTQTPQILADRNYRYNTDQRWPAILQNSLIGHQVIEEGQPSRTLVHNPPYEGNKSGIRYLKPCLEQHSPQLLIIMLGTNDLKSKYDLSAVEICQGLSSLVKQTLNYYVAPNKKTAAKILLICPPAIDEVGHYSKMYAGGAEKSKQLAQLYQQCALKLNCTFLDAGTIITSSIEDGIHWQADQHQLLAEALEPLIEKLISDEN